MRHLHPNNFYHEPSILVNDQSKPSIRNLVTDRTVRDAKQVHYSETN